MGLEYIITIVGFVILIYFMERPTEEIQEDELDCEINCEGLPSNDINQL